MNHVDRQWSGRTPPCHGHKRWPPRLARRRQAGVYNPVFRCPGNLPMRGWPPEKANLRTCLACGPTCAGRTRHDQLANHGTVVTLQTMAFILVPTRRQIPHVECASFYGPGEPTAPLPGDHHAWIGKPRAHRRSVHFWRASIANGPAEPWAANIREWTVLAIPAARDEASAATSSPSGGEDRKPGNAAEHLIGRDHRNLQTERRRGDPAVSLVDLLPKWVTFVFAAVSHGCTD